MKHCPNPSCGSTSRHGLAAEYTDEAERCTHCSGPLATGRAADPEPESDWADLVRVATFREVHEAHLARALLASEGIDAFLTNAHLSGVAWPYGAVAGGVPLQVRPEDAAAATELLESSGGEAADAAFGSSSPLEEACPRCGAAQPERFERPRRWLALLEMLLAAALPAPKKSGLRCRVCRLEYYA